MILTGNEINKQVQVGNIIIDPYIERNVNPNSYNYRLGDYYTIVTQASKELNNRRNPPMLEIPKKGLLLIPKNIYLATTFEVIGSSKYVVSLIGRSSLGRLGLFLQLSADLGNLGPAHKWTLELTCAQPIIVYPQMKIGQVSFWIPEGDIEEYHGGYTDFNVPKHSEYKKLFGVDK